MNRAQYLALRATLIVALTAPAQPRPADKDATQADMPTVEQQLQVLTDKLDLTSDQQARIKPTLKQLHDATQKLMHDKSLSREQRLARVRPQRHKADKQMRDILSDYQKKKLDEYEQGPHPEMHGSLSGTKPPPQQSP